MPLRRQQRLAPAATARARAPPRARSSPKPSTRVSTRLTLPSRIATRSPKQKAAIAAAVERPMPGSSASAAALRGKSPPCSATTDLRAAVQVARAAVVAEAAPQREHVVERRGGERAHVGKAGQEARVVVEHRRHLRLLQHDLRQPDAVRVAAALPGQVVAAVLALPRDHLRGEAPPRRGAPASAGSAARRRPPDRLGAARCGDAVVSARRQIAVAVAAAAQCRPAWLAHARRRGAASARPASRGRRCAGRARRPRPGCAPASRAGA